LKKKLYIFIFLLLVFFITTNNYQEKKQLTNIINYQTNAKETYTPNSYHKYLSAIDYAKKIKYNLFSKKEKINEAKNYLLQTINELYTKPNKSVLINLYETANNIDTNIYIPKSIPKLKTAIYNAKNIIDDDNALLEDVDNVINDIDTAIKDLILKPDKTILKNKIEIASTVQDNNYTTKSYKNLINTISNAKYTYKNENSTQKEVNEIIKNIDDSIKNLTKATKGVYRILTNTYKTSNNHVGNEWYTTITHNGKDFEYYNTITAPFNSTYITLNATIVEDDKIPDIGYGSITILLKDGNTKTRYIDVVENRGRYYGNIATWEFKCIVELIEKV